MLVVLAAAALATGGCLAAAVGAAAGGATAGFVYLRGSMYREYAAALPATAAAVRTALAELQFPAATEKDEIGKVTIETKTGDGVPVKIHLATVATRIPSDGPITHVSIRVGVFGDETVSEKILDQAGLHLAPPVAQAPPAALAPIPIQPQVNGPRETPPPPLSGPVPITK
ncbi:MAG: DUF3568 family protein [Candidatus Acidiferrum sp.]